MTRNLQYIALIRKEAESDFGVSFPGFPYCVRAGATLDEAKGMAAGALGFHIEGTLQDGDPLPEPPSLEAVMADGDNRDGVAILVAAGPRQAKSVRVYVTLPADFLAEVDR